MNDPILLYKVTLSSEHKPTGRTRHYRSGAELRMPAQLEIVRYSDDPGYYLLYCDEQGRELTDTYHETVEKAMAQAEWEFQVKPSEWERISEQ